jgi:hypothetical protein
VGRDELDPIAGATPAIGLFYSRSLYFLRGRGDARSLVIRSDLHNIVILIYWSFPLQFVSRSGDNPQAHLDHRASRLSCWSLLQYRPSIDRECCCARSTACPCSTRHRKDAAALRSSVVAKAERSPAAVTKQTTGQTEDGLPVHSFHTLLADLATLTRNTVVTAIDRGRPFTLTARPTLFSKRRSTSRPRRYPVIPSLGACFLREINNLRDHKEGSPV